MSFIEDCVAGKAVKEDVDEYIDRWTSITSNGESHVSLRGFLGMYVHEYELFLLCESNLEEIIENRKKGN